MELYVQEGKVFQQGVEVVPDEAGIVIVTIEGKQRRFVKDKMVDWLTKNKNVKKPKRLKKPVKTYKPKKAEERKQRRAEVDKNGETFGPFISQNLCGRSLGLPKSVVSKALSKKTTTKSGYKFYYGQVRLAKTGSGAQGS